MPTISNSPNAAKEGKKVLAPATEAPATEAKKERTTIGYALLYIDNLNYFAGASLAGASSVAGASSTAAGVTSISSTSNSKASLGPIN